MAIDVTKADLTDEAIRTGSGKGWQEWVDLLDAWGGRNRTHTEIARHIVELGVDGWWAQGVTVGYERIIGRRVTGQRSDGRFSGSASATFPVGADRLTALLVEDDERRTWLVPDTLTVRTVQPGKSARFDQADSAGILAAWLTDKGPDKCSVQVQEEGFPSKEAADAFRATWKARFAALRAHIESSTA